MNGMGISPATDSTLTDRCILGALFERNGASRESEPCLRDALEPIPWAPATAGHAVPLEVDLPTGYVWPLGTLPLTRGTVVWAVPGSAGDGMVPLCLHVEPERPAGATVAAVPPRAYVVHPGGEWNVPGVVRTLLGLAPTTPRRTVSGGGTRPS